MMKYLTIAIMSLAILVGSHQISRVERDGSWVCMYNESGKKVPDPQRKQCRRCHWCCRQYIHLPQRQLDLYLGQKRQETQHPFRQIIVKRLRGYRITNFEVESPATALAGGKSV